MLGWCECGPVWRAPLALVMSETLRRFWYRLPLFNDPAMLVHFLGMIDAKNGSTNRPVQPGGRLRAHRLRLIVRRTPETVQAREIPNVVGNALLLDGSPSRTDFGASTVQPAASLCNIRLVAQPNDTGLEVTD